jgi:FkbH-like protein
VPEWPADKLLYEQALAELTCFDTLMVTAEDQARTRMYVAEQQRRDARQAVQSLDAYLATLDLTMTVERMDRSNVTRAVQLLNKTNQFNLSTRRMTEARYLEWAAPEGRDVFVFRVSDRFDDYGLTGIGSVSTEEGTGYLTDFLLSCRVMGRGVEQAMLHAIAEHARSLGLVRLVATYTPTARNAPCRQFFDEQSRFSRSADGHQYVWDLHAPYPRPEHIRIQYGSNAHASASAQRVPS